MADLYDVIVIGGGPAGMAAAISAAEEGASVLLLEKEKRSGQKLLLTGNGRCNLTNLDPELPAAFHSSDADALKDVTAHIFSVLDARKTIDWFQSLGLLCHDRNGYVYPRSDQASSVLRVLQKALKTYGVKQKNAVKIIRMEPDERGIWQIDVDGWCYRSRSVILAAGAKAYAETGSDGSGLELAKHAGHHIVPVLPALTGICVQESVQKAAGARTDARVTLTAAGHSYQEEGQVQWNSDGFSGICIMQLSGHAAKVLDKAHDSRDICLTLDLLPDWSEEALQQYLEKMLSDCQSAGPSDKTSTFLTGFVPDRVADYLTETYLPVSLKDTALMEQAGYRIAHLLKHCRFTVNGTRSFDRAQVCSGGVDLSEIHPHTLESVIQKGLFFAGEILDADGPCGGYNLQWAWSTGFTAGKNAACGCIPKT